MTEFKRALADKLTGLGLSFSDTLLNTCAVYFEKVAEANNHLNLTRITDEAQAAEQHFADAMALCRAFELPKGCRVIDIGTGAGFPGVPLKLLRPDLDMTLLDASGKKTDFIQAALEQMGVSANVVCGRAEELARGALRESFDAAVSRAVAPLPMLLELSVPLLKTGGTLAAWKGETYETELSDAAKALETLGCRLADRFLVGRGAILLILKQKPTPGAYPRRFSKIKSAPL